MKRFEVKIMLETAFLESDPDNENIYKRQLAIKLVSKLPIENLERLFNFTKFEMKQDPEYEAYFPNNELIRLTASINIEE
jgi:hypothetical protein